MKKEPDKKKLAEAIEQLKADLDDLSAHIPTWNSQTTSAGKEYRPIADRIVAGAQRLKALVRENTYSPN
jgi:hypothetical protein